jgi:hypothetical protein
MISMYKNPVPKPHTVRVRAMTRWLWGRSEVFASSTRENKKIEVELRRGRYRVHHGKRIVYQGDSPTLAVEAYNAITRAP